jgi:hypothetical protein
MVGVSCANEQGYLVGAEAAAGLACGVIQDTALLNLELELRRPALLRARLSRRACGPGELQAIAALDPSSGTLSAAIVLETTAPSVAPKGKIAIQILDGAGAAIALVESTEIAGKLPRGSEVQYSASVQLSDAIRTRAASISIDARCIEGADAQGAAPGSSAEPANELRLTVR